jgi:hypothetical protein
MELILAILLAGPTGFLLRSYRRGLAVYLATWAIVLPIQTVAVYSQDDGGWLYWLINAAILAAGIGLNRLGWTVGRRRRSRNTAAIEPLRP